MADGVLLNGRFLSYEDLAKGAYAANSEFEKNVADFCRDWWSKNPTFEVMSSGSTGKPKRLVFTRSQFERSARQTIDTFHLRPGQAALLCLSPEFIAGKMMIVRALTGKLNLIAIEPAENPLLECEEKIHFAAVVPQQLKAMFENPHTSKKAEEIDTIIVGGSSVEHLPPLQFIKNNVYHTFGMTETLTHVAVRKISGTNPEKYYSTLNGVEIKTDERDCLMVKSPVNDQWIITNDIVEIDGSNHFRWIGRYDNIVNSGGIKISPEEVEKEIGEFLKANGITAHFFVCGIPDVKLGEKLVLVVEENEGGIDKKNVLKGIKNVLPKYKSPKDVFLCPRFVYTTSGKIKRKETLNLIARHDL